MFEFLGSTGEFSARNERGLDPEIQGFRRIAQAVKKGEPQTFTLEQYQPLPNPQPTTPITSEITKAGDGGTVEMSGGAYEMTGTTDDSEAVRRRA